MVNWTEITETYPNFTPQLQKKWEAKDFTAEEAKEWMEFGLEPEEADFAVWLKKKYNVTSEEFLGDDDMEELRGRYRKELEESAKNIQEWLDQQYPKEERENIKELYINKKNIEGELDLSDFTKLEKIFISHFVDENKLEIKDKEKHESRIVRLRNAQKFLEEYLEKDYSGKQKSEITEISISDKNLEGDLKIENFPNLKTLNCQLNYLSDVKVINCPNITHLDIGNNLLKSFDFSSLISPEKLIFLNVGSNDFKEQSIDFLENFINLKELYLDSIVEWKIKQGIRNRFNGSLSPLEKLTKLEKINISNTDIDSGLEHLSSDNIKWLGCDVVIDSDFKVSKIWEQLALYGNNISTWKEWKRRGFNSEEVKQWKEVGLNENEYDFAAYLKRQKGYNNIAEIKAEDIENSREDFKDWIKIAQNYLDNYSPEEKGKVPNLNISNKNLKGSLDLSDFENFENLDCGDNKLTAVTGLSNKNKLTSFRCSSNQLTSLEINNCEELTDFKCLYNQLTELKITNCPKLSTIDCDTNKLENLDVGDLSSLTSLDCRNNLLTNITLPKETTSLKTLYLQSNKFSKDKDFSFLTSFANLESLDLGESEQFALYDNSIKAWKEWTKRGLNDQEIKKIKEAGVGIYDYKFSDYLNKENCKVSSANKEELEKKIKDYRQVQTWMDINYPEGERGKKTNLDISNKSLEGSLNLKGFNNLKEFNCSNNKITELNLENCKNLTNLNCLTNPITKLNITEENLLLNKVVADKKFCEGNDFIKNSFVLVNENKYIRKQNAQEWLDENFPNDKESNLAGYEGKKREDIETLDISEKGLSGKLDLTGFTGLNELNCSENGLTSLNLSNCTKLNKVYCYLNQLSELELSNLNDLTEFSCYGNNLTNCDFIKKLNPKKLTLLSIRDNNFTEQSIEIFSDFVKLKILRFENTDEGRIKNGVYNRFNGSLEHLKNISELEIVGVSNTDLDSGVEYLPDSIKEIYCSLEERPNSKLKNIKEKLDSYQKESNNRSTKKRLNRMYPDKSAKVLDNLYSEGLKGHLDLSEYKNLEELRCHNNELTSIDISKNKELKKINCSNNKLKEINLENNVNLEELSCSNDHLENLLGLENCSELSLLNGVNERKELKEFLLKFPTTKDKVDELVERIIKNGKIRKKREERKRLEGQWKEKDVDNWLEKEYPEDGRCLGNFDWENKGKKRGEINELDISGEELTGSLDLKGFTSLRHLICRDNQLKNINLRECKKLEIIDCRKNKLKSVEFRGDNLNLKEFRGSDNEFENLKSITGHINPKSLDYFDINNNKIRGGEISDFSNFENLQRLYIGNTKKKENSAGNEFSGSLESLESMRKLLEIDIRNNTIKINDFLKKKESWPKGLEKIYYTFEKDESSKGGKNGDQTGSEKQKVSKEPKEEIIKKDLYNEEGEFWDIKASRDDNKTSGYSEVKIILKTPLLSTNKKHKAELVKDNYDTKKIDYYNEGKAIYPSEEETGFRWEISEQLSTSDLPIRLCHVNNDAFKFFSFKKYFEKNDIASISLDEKSSNVLKIRYEGDKEEHEVKNIDKKPELQEIKLYLEKNNKYSLDREELKNAKIEIKKRVECANDAKHYAILSYSWGGKHKEEIKWSLENAEKRLSPGGVKSLDKAVKTLRVLNEFHSLENIKHLWMDQLCVNQDNPKEKGHEVSKMRDYYGNATVTLIAIHAEVGEKNIKKLLKSFERGESGLIYPNEIIGSSLPILEKIIGSEWFSRSWTYQEGFLSKRTIFMFDDFLIDGRFMALIWKLKQFSSTHYEECKWVKDLCGEKSATPVGWVYYEGEDKRGYSLGDKASLRLTEALWAVKDRGRALPIDGIYSIIGLLPYSEKVTVNYEKDPESVLREVMLTAVSYGHGEPLAWSGWGSRKLGLCWVPAIGENGSSSVAGGIKIGYNYEKGKLNFAPNEGIKIQASEYVISKKSSGLYEVEMREAMEGSLWRREVWIRIEGGEKKLVLSGTKEGIEAVDKGRMLIVPNKEEWKSDVPFAILSLKVRDSYIEKTIEEIVKKNFPPTLEQAKKLEKLKELKKKDNLRHRIDLVRIEEGYENLIEKDENGNEKPKSEEKTFIIGFNSQENIEQFQDQIEIPTNK